MAQEFEVVIVGAGAAGIAAARETIGAGRTTCVLEAGVRIGGRAWTETSDGMPLDLGCGWLHSAARNPLVALGEGAGFAIDRAPTAWGTQYRDLGFAPAEQADARAAWAAFQRRLADVPPFSDRAADALHRNGAWHAYAQALSGYMNGADLDQLSVADYLTYEAAAGADNWRVPAGYGTLIAALAADLPVHFATPVSAIDRSGVRLLITTPRGDLSARAVIVTVSTAVLAAGAIRFSPRLDDQLAAAADLPLGLADKLFLALRDGHGLEPDTHLLGNPHRAETGSYYLRPFARPVIEGFFGGSGAIMLEREGLAAAFAFAIDELCALLGSDFRAKLRPLAGSSWCRMDHFGGSYSHARPGRAGARTVLASPIDDRLFFAGEATHPTDFSTAHGAWDSGRRAARAALAGFG